MDIPSPTPPKSSEPICSPSDGGTAFGCPRDFLENRFVYTVISPRARGLTVGVNMNPDRRCNFDCVYCEVKRGEGPTELRLDPAVMRVELERTLEWVQSGAIATRPCYGRAPAQLLQLQHVALSGDGEPTHCPDFVAGVEAVVHLRACGRFPFFKFVLITNASGLHRPEVQEGLKHFTALDEIWAKLEAGTNGYMRRVNRPDILLEGVLSNILLVARRRPVVIQSLFMAIDGEAPPASEVEEYVQRLRELKAQGAQIPLVQVYSASRPSPRSEYSHLPLRALSSIAQRIREVSGLRAEVY